jgi:polyphosphate glucokinase
MIRAMGVDVGGTGTKGAIVDLSSGELVTDRYRLPTPQPSTPEAVADTVGVIVASAGWDGPVGCALPAVVTGGVVRTAANIDSRWVDTDGCAVIGAAVGAPITLLNDADAAGMAEMRFGIGKGRGGVVLVLTFGTGIGSALFVEGRLVPNTELGHLQMWGDSAEERAAASGRERSDLSWEDWVGDCVNPYLRYVEDLLWPDLIVVGGGISKKPDRWVPLLEARAELLVAELRNNAGIAGAALACSEAHHD